ncbi:MAG: trigger factor [Candidatus Komeilibacteria bacterium]
MEVSKKDLEKNEVELTITIQPVEMENWLVKAASRLAKNAKIEGFRPGKAPYEVIKNKLGESRIYEEALDDIITHYYWQAVKDHNLNTVGQPQININKFAPNNELVFVAKSALLPKVVLGKYTDLKIEEKKVEATDKEVAKVLDDLREMRVKESAKLEAAASGDKVELDFSITLNGKPIQNGQAEKYNLVLGQGKMIAGFEDQVVGMKPGEEKKFKLKFPANYHSGEVAGKDADFAIKVHNIWRRELPELNDEFVKELGAFNTVEDLKKQIKNNMTQEKQYKARQEAEIAMLEKIIDNSEFEPIPDVLVDAEKDKMLHELQHSVEQQGLNWSDYLKSIKKDEVGLKQDFQDGAERRVKTALIMRLVSEQEKLRVSPEEVQAEIAKLKEQYQDNPTAQENLKNDGYIKYLENSLNNDKVIAWLREKNIVTPEAKEK